MKYQKANEYDQEMRKANEYDQEMRKSQIPYQFMAPQGRDMEQ